MDYLLIRDRNNLFEEILIDIDYSSLKYEYEKNTTRSLSFTAIRTPFNAFSFDMLVNESIITYQGQQFIVKLPPPTVIGNVYTKDIQAFHISYGVQDYANYKVYEGEQTYTLQQAMDIAMKDNLLGYSYKLIGNFPTVKLTDLGGKNALSMITDFLESFGAIMLADNKQIILYSEDQFYIQTEKIYYQLYNTEEVSIVPDTTNLKTIGKAYGRLRDDADLYSGDDRYTAVATYTSPNAAEYGFKMADLMFNDDIDNNKDLLAWLKAQLQDEPELSIDLTYTGDEEVTERDIWYFIHKPLQIDANVKVNRLTKYHPWSNQPFEVGFSNAKKDMVKISRQIAKQADNATKAVKTTKIDITATKQVANKAYDNRLITEYVKYIPDSISQMAMQPRVLSEYKTLEWIKSPTTKENMYAMTHIDGVKGLAENYVAQESGKELSTNDYLDEDKEKVQKISDTGYYINDAITGKPMIITVENGVVKAKEVI